MNPKSDNHNGGTITMKNLVLKQETVRNLTRFTDEDGYLNTTVPICPTGIPGGPPTGGFQRN
jgi:hypothetical protein